MWLSSKSGVGYSLWSYLITPSRSNCQVLETTRNCWKSNPGSILLSGATVTANELLSLWLICLVVSYKSEGKYILSKHCVHYIPSHWIVLTHIDIFFLHNTVYDVSQRGVSRKRRTWWQLSIYFWNVQSVSFNSWDTGIFVLLACGVFEFIIVLHANIVKPPDVLSDFISFRSITRSQPRPA